ncbi:MAG TPA: hypothetical protein VF624_18885 [Tepidisphaeraceae bacterium]
MHLLWIIFALVAVFAVLSATSNERQRLIESQPPPPTGAPVAGPVAPGDGASSSQPQH